MFSPIFSQSCLNPVQCSPKLDTHNIKCLNSNKCHLALYHQIYQKYSTGKYRLYYKATYYVSNNRSTFDKKEVTVPRLDNHVTVHIQSQV